MYTILVIASYHSRDASASNVSMCSISFDSKDEAQEAMDAIISKDSKRPYFEVIRLWK